MCIRDSYYLRRQFNDLHELFEAYKMDRVFSSPEALIEATQSLSARQRALLMDMIRSNPNISGYSLTMADVYKRQRHGRLRMHV